MQKQPNQQRWIKIVVDQTISFMKPLVLIATSLQALTAAENSPTLADTLLAAQKTDSVAVHVQFTYAPEEKNSRCTTEMKPETLRSYIAKGMQAAEVEDYQTKPFAGAPEIVSPASITPALASFDEAATDADLKGLYRELRSKKVTVLISLTSTANICQAQTEKSSRWSSTAEMRFHTRVAVYALRNDQLKRIGSINVAYKAEVQKSTASVRTAVNGHTMQIKLGLAK